MLYTLLLLLLLIGGTVIALQIPQVQTEVVQRIAAKLSELLNFPIHVTAVRIKWFDTLTLQGVHIDDRAAHPMIQINELDLNFALKSLLDTANINVDEATLHGARVRLVVEKRTGELNMDEFIQAINELTRSKDTTAKGGSDPAFTIDRVTLENSLFSYSDNREDSLPRNEFDYYHFTLDSLNTSAEHFKIAADTVEITVVGMRFVDRASRLRFHEMNTAFRYTKRNMTFDNLLARINQSTIRDRLVFNYPNGTDDFGDFNEKIKMEAHFDSTSIHSQDLALFAPDVSSYREDWRISGDFKGKVNSFKIKDMDFYFGKISRLSGNVSFDGLPDIRETFMNLDLLKSVIQAADVKQYVDADAYRVVEKFGKVGLKGKFVGFSRDFVANGAFETALGRLTSDINLKINKVSGKSTYEGKLTSTNFELGKLIDYPETIQKIDMSGHVAGQGLSLKDAALTLNANVSRFGFNYYDYQHIEVNGKLQRSMFDGQVSIRDPNLVFDLAGEVNLKEAPNHVEIAGKIEKADLKALKLSKEELNLQTDLNVQFVGLDLDEIEGEATFLNSTIVYRNRSLNLDSLYLFSSKDEAGRTFTLNSDLVSVNANGKFAFTQAAADMQQLLKEYQLYFMRGEKERNAYYQQKNKNALVRRKYRIEYQFQFKNINPVIALFDPNVYVARNTQLEGVFANGNTSIFSFNSHIDTLIYANYRFYGTSVDLNTSKLADSSNVLAEASISSKSQKLNNFTPTEEIAIEGVWNQDRIDFTGKIHQTKSTNLADLRGNIRFIPDGLLVEFKPSRFRILDNEWNIARNNTITVIGREITFRDLSVANRSQIIAVNGVISDDSTKMVKLEVQDFNLVTLAPLINRDVQGTLNGYVDLRNVYDSLGVESEMTLEELVIDRFLIGNVSGETRWDNAKQRLKADYQIERMGREIMSLRGTYNPNTKEGANSLNLVAELRQADLEILEPFTKEFISNLGGTASGNVKITGKLAAPLLKGELAISKGRLKFNYLNTVFHFEDKIFFSENEIGTKRMRLLDDEGNAALLHGGVYHDGFRAFVLDLSATLTNFKILNTTEKNGESYYGTAFATGKASVFGPLNNLAIQANARSDKGTRIYIPLDRTSTIEQQDYIQFASRTKADTTHRQDIQKMDLSGIKLDFDFDITPDAYCELIFDKQVGDIIKATGNGRIKMQIDTKGDFTMLGTYEIVAGSYNFTFLNVVNKQFTIQPNSRITWTGDPYSAILNINAAYVQLASLAPILTVGETERNKPENQRRYPASVLLNLTGNLMSPQIDLDIDIKDYPRIFPFTQDVPSFQSVIHSNEQELSRQVFSLMILRQFSPLNSFSSNNVIGNSVSELLSNQFSYWASQVDPNLQIDFNLNGLDQAAINNFQLRLSYAFLNGRLRLTRDGSFTNARNESDARSVLGEWTLEYWLTTDGKFRMKVYNRNNQNLLTSDNSNNINTTKTGFSLLHTQSFNSFGELIRPKKKRKAIEIPLDEEEQKSEASEQPAILSPTPVPGNQEEK